jgi:GDA1/CD39 (nucleoside phosphatase) family
VSQRFRRLDPALAPAASETLFSVGVFRELDRVQASEGEKAARENPPYFNHHWGLMRRSSSGALAFMVSGASSKLPMAGYERVNIGPKAISPGRRFAWLAIKLVALGALLAIAIGAVISMRPPVERVFGLMIDAGSTGSRMHTFSFTRDPSNNLQLITEDFLPVKPGLSAFKDSPGKASESLQPLLERARSIVPKAKRSETPVFLRATAGLRLTGEEKANAILGDVRKGLRKSGFRFDEDHWASILGGSDEGIYSWITVNYLMDRVPTDTVGTLEMGGGSAQVAFVPIDKSNLGGGNCSVPTETIEFKGIKIPLYTYSHLKFGLKKARAIALTGFRSGGMLKDNPCVNHGPPVTYPIPFDTSDAAVRIRGSGNFDSCRRAIDSLLFEPVKGHCTCTACTYHAVSAPKPSPEYVAFAFYLERTVAIGMSSPLTVEDIHAKGKEICSLTVDQVLKSYPNVPNGIATDLCLDLAFIAGHLEHGLGINDGQSVKLNIVDKIKGVELGWSLGAMFAEMGRLGIGQ